MSRSTLARSIVALAGVAAVGLPAASAQAVPAAKTTHPDTAVLAAHLMDQGLDWQACFGIAAPSGVTPQCATITVPRDWHHPTDGNTIEVAISWVPTAGEDRQGIILTNPGGPGSAGLTLPGRLSTSAPELAAEFDFVGFDPRGVGKSTPLRCSVVQEDWETYEAEMEARVNGCLENPLTPFITTEQTAYDMDFIRALMGEEKTNYVGYSYGTWLGKWYQSVFPGHANRFVLDSAAEVSSKTLESTWDLQNQTRDRQLQERLMPYLARNADTFLAPSDDARELRRLYEVGGGTRSDYGYFMAAYFIIPGMYNNTSYPLAAGTISNLARQGAAIEAGRATAPADMSALEQREALQQLVDEVAALEVLTDEDRALLRQQEERALEALDSGRLGGLPQGAVGEVVTYDYAFEAVRCQDGPWNQSAGYWKAWSDNIARKAPWIGWAVTGPACQWFPAVTEMPKVSGKKMPATLMLQSEMDVATPYESGLKSAQTLTNISLISVDDEGTHGLYPYGTECVDDAVNAYMLDGVLPEDRFTGCQARPLPNETEVFPVGESLAPNGKAKMKLLTDEVREANRMLRELLAQEQAAADSL